MQFQNLCTSYDKNLLHLYKFCNISKLVWFKKKQDFVLQFTQVCYNLLTCFLNEECRYNPIKVITSEIELTFVHSLKNELIWAKFKLTFFK